MFWICFLLACMFDILFCRVIARNWTQRELLHQDNKWLTYTSICYWFVLCRMTGCALRKAQRQSNFFFSFLLSNKIFKRNSFFSFQIRLKCNWVNGFQKWHQKLSHYQFGNDQKQLIRFKWSYYCVSVLQSVHLLFVFFKTTITTSNCFGCEFGCNVRVCVCV